MRIEPLLVLVSGVAPTAEEHDNPFAFTTTTRGLQFTSCSGLLLTTGGSLEGFVLMPAAVLRRWSKAGVNWLTSQSNADPPVLTTDCAICAVGPTTALSGGAANCIPIATVRVPAISHAAAQVLQSLNRDISFSNWAFGWHIGGPHCTAAEQGSFVLCWAQPLSGHGFGTAASAGLAPAPGVLQTPATAPRLGAAALAAATFTSAAAAAAATAGSPPFTARSAAVSWPQPLPERHVVDDEGAATGAAAATADLPPLNNPKCVALLLSVYASLPAIRTVGVAAGSDGVASAAPSRQSSMPNASAAAAAAAAAGGPPCVGAGVAPGRLVSVVGSPFGCLAPFHFFNATINGTVACAFPAPPDTLATTTIAADGAVTAAARRGCDCGPALYALDAHVFPGMEGALVTPLQLPLTVPAAPDSAPFHGPRQTPPLGAGTGGGALLLHTRHPLALLCTPVSRRADGVQVPLAAAWSHVEAALQEVLAQLLLRAQGSLAADSVAVATHPKQRQQLQLQPVAAAPSPLRSAASAFAPVGCAGGSYSSVQPDLGCGSEAGRRGGGGGKIYSLLGAWEGRCNALRTCDGGGGGGAAVRGDHVRGRHVVAAPCSGDGGGAATAAMPPEATASCCSCTAVTPLACDPCPVPAAAVAAAMTSLPAQVLRAVVLLRCNGSWATGVVVEGGLGLVITTAHLFQRPCDDAGAAAAPRQPHGKRGRGGAGGGSEDPWAHLQCWARVHSDEASAGEDAACGACGAIRRSGRRGLTYRWLRARVLYIWSNHLDLAVLQLELSFPAVLPAVQETAHAKDDSEREAFVFRRTAAAAPEVAGCVVDGGSNTNGSDHGRHDEGMYGTYGAGSPVWAVGHSLMGPAADWPALVSYGCIARVLRARSGRPSMVIATTTTHAGGSGGALLDFRGRLLGLVTSNARHAGGTTLPNMAFCIAAEELEPVIRWAATWGRSAETATTTATTAASTEATRDTASSGASPQEWGLAALAAMDVEDPDAARIWRLQMPSIEPLAPADGPMAIPAAAIAAAAATAGPDGDCCGCEAAAPAPSGTDFRSRL